MSELKMIYWKSQHFWFGKRVDHPEFMSQGETLEELEENLRDVWHEMVFEDVPLTIKSRSSRFEAR